MSSKTRVQHHDDEARYGDREEKMGGRGNEKGTRLAESNEGGRTRGQQWLTMGERKRERERACTRARLGMQRKQCERKRSRHSKNLERRRQVEGGGFEASHSRVERVKQRVTEDKKRKHRNSGSLLSEQDDTRKPARRHRTKQDRARAKSQPRTRGRAAAERLRRMLCSMHHNVADFGERGDEEKRHARCKTSVLASRTKCSPLSFAGSAVTRLPPSAETSWARRAAASPLRPPLLVLLAPRQGGLPSSR